MSSNSPAARRNTSADVIKKIKMQEKINAAQRRRQVSGTGPVSFGVTTPTAGASGGFNANISIDTGKLSVAGDVMMGPIAFNPQEKTISSGTLTISGLLIQSSSYIIVDGEGSANDDLNTIAGAQFAGQFLVLKAKAGVDITLKHLADNITIPGGADHVMTADTSVVLVFDNTLNKWMLVASHAAGGGGGTEVPDWTEAHRANGYTLFLDADDNSNINAAVDDQVRIQTGGNTRMTWENTLITISDTVDVDPSSDGGVNLGSGSKQYGQVHSQTFSMWTDTTNDTTTTEAKIFRNSTRGLTLKSPSVGGSYGKHTFTDKDGVDRIIFDYDASNKNAIFNYTTGGLKVRQNASDTDGVLIYPRGNTFSSSENLLNSMGGNLSIRKDGIEKILIETSTITMTNDLDMDGEGIGNTTSIGFSTGQDITADGGGIDYKVPSGDKHEFLVAGTSVGRFVDYGLEMKDSYWVKPENNGGERMGIAATNLNNPVTVGTYGSIIIPRHSVSSSSSITTANLDSWFGSYRGCIGYLTTLSSYTNRLYVKDPLTNTWAYFNADGYV